MLDGIRHEHGCGVLVVHHAGLVAGRERGSTALAYAADYRWETDGKPREPSVTLRNDKQKDWEPSPPVVLRRHVVGERGSDEASLILRLASDPCHGHERVAAVLDGGGAVTQRPAWLSKRSTGSGGCPCIAVSHGCPWMLANAVRRRAARGGRR